MSFQYNILASCTTLQVLQTVEQTPDYVFSSLLWHRELQNPVSCFCSYKEYLNTQKVTWTWFMVYVFFWVIPRSLDFICQRFGTLCLFHLHRQVGVKNDYVWEMLGYLYGKKCGSKIAWTDRKVCDRVGACLWTCPYSVTLLPIGSGYFQVKPSV